MDLELLHTVVSDAMPLVAAFLSAWLTRGRRPPRPPEDPGFLADPDRPEGRDA